MCRCMRIMQSDVFISYHRIGGENMQNEEQSSRVTREVKDRLFRFLFENDKENLLQLYNALNGTDYHDVNALQVVTIKNAVYITMKNDLAFVLMGTLNMYEHQSTYSSNMPARFLIYLAEEYQKIISNAESSLYGTKQISLPTPRCVVFYNGEKEMPEEKVLRLSDAFENKDKEADVELKVRMLNINRGHNEKLMENCKTLKEYAAFVEISRQYISDIEDRNEALTIAIDYCIDHDILSGFLRKNRSEVLGMLLEEFDAEKYEKTIREEGIQRANKLTLILIAQNRLEDLTRAAEDAEFQNELFKEFGI